MKRFACLCFLLTGCATTTTYIDKTATFPGYHMTTFVFGSAKMAKSAQNFHGNLTVTEPNGTTVVVGLNNGQNTEGLEATGLEAVVKAIVKGVVESIVPVPHIPLLPLSLSSDQQDVLKLLLENDLREEYNKTA